MNIIQKLSLIGSGNVATHLGKSLFAAGIKIDTVFSRNIDNATELAEKIDSEPVNKIKNLSKNSDIYIFSVSDEAISPLAIMLSKYIGRHNRVVHTSGMVNSNVFKDLFDDYGVFYPLQTFTKNRELDISKVPFCITANNKNVENDLLTLANKISTDVNIIKDKERMKLHVAAVFVNNFTNFMYSIGKDITEKEKLDFGLLFPLMEETTAKVLEGYNPESIQTGPAVRSDENTVRQHLKYLKKFPKYMKVYKILTELIMK